jgi:hypothetical protein
MICWRRSDRCFFNYAEIDLPLEEVRKNLLLAQGMAEHGELKEARTALEEASAALEA